MDALRNEIDALREEVAMLSSNNEHLRTMMNTMSVKIEKLKQENAEMKINWARKRESYAREH